METNCKLFNSVIVWLAVASSPGRFFLLRTDEKNGPGIDCIFLCAHARYFRPEDAGGTTRMPRFGLNHIKRKDIRSKIRICYTAIADKDHVVFTDQIVLRKNMVMVSECSTSIAICRICCSTITTKATHYKRLFSPKSIEDYLPVRFSRGHFLLVVLESRSWSPLRRLGI